MMLIEGCYQGPQYEQQDACEQDDIVVYNKLNYNMKKDFL